MNRQPSSNDRASDAGADATSVHLEIDGQALAGAAWAAT